MEHCSHFFEILHAGGRMRWRAYWSFTGFTSCLREWQCRGQLSMFKWSSQMRISGIKRIKCEEWSLFKMEAGNEKETANSSHSSHPRPRTWWRNSNCGAATGWWDNSATTHSGCGMNWHRGRDRSSSSPFNRKICAALCSETYIHMVLCYGNYGPKNIELNTFLCVSKDKIY